MASASCVRLSLRTLLLIVAFHVVHSSAGDGIKRVPQGFIGMRGKKYFDYDDTSPYEKRRSQGFVGVKGKKDNQPYDLPYNLFYKRAPMGFVGMRGRRDYYEPVSVEYPRISAEFVPKRGSILGQIDYSSSADDALDNDQFSLLNDLIQRYVHDNQDETDGVSTLNNGIDTNSVEQLGTSELTKRAAHTSQFFGVRGKKSDQSYRGNKRPFDLTFRGKFVGVRGKKSGNADGADEGISKRKASGFFGVRGKKWIETDVPSGEAVLN